MALIVSIQLSIFFEKDILGRVSLATSVIQVLPDTEKKNPPSNGADSG